MLPLIRSTLPIYLIATSFCWLVVFILSDGSGFPGMFGITLGAVWLPSILALMMGLFACAGMRLPTPTPAVKAVPWIMGGLLVEMFIPLIIIAAWKIHEGTMSHSAELQAMLRYMLFGFPLCLIAEKGLVLRLFNQNTNLSRSSSQTQNQGHSPTTAVPAVSPENKTST